MPLEKPPAAFESCIHDLHDELFYLRYALDQHAIVSMADLYGRITCVNDNFCRISGYSRDELLGQDHAILRSGLHPKGFFQDMFDALARGEIWQGEICNRAKDGKLYWVRATMLMYGDTTGLPARFISIRTDITQHKSNELELKYYVSQMEEILRTKTAELQRALALTRVDSLANSERVAPMSQEVCTSMNGVIGTVDVLQRTLSDAIDFSWPEVGHMEVERIATPLKEVADSVLQRMLGTASDKGVLLWLSVAPDVPAAIYADPVRLRQVLLHLVGNAIKFTLPQPGETGEVTLALECGAMADGQPGVLLHVRDKGIGMSATVVERLFQPLVQGEPFTAREIGRTGLGLSVSQKWVALMGGQITVNSAPEKGSVFTVVLPLHVAPAERSATQTKEPPLPLRTTAIRAARAPGTS